PGGRCKREGKTEGEAESHERGSPNSWRSSLPAAFADDEAKRMTGGNGKGTDFVVHAVADALEDLRGRARPIVSRDRWRRGLGDRRGVENLEADACRGARSRPGEVPGRGGRLRECAGECLGIDRGG